MFTLNGERNGCGNVHWDAGKPRIVFYSKFVLISINDQRMKLFLTFFPPADTFLN